MIIRPEAAPIPTPPEIVPFNMCAIVNLDFRKAVVVKVARQLPARAIIVLEIICVFAKGVFADTPKLTEGQ